MSASSASPAREPRARHSPPTAASTSFCSTCAFSEACLSQGMDKRELGDLHVLVEHVGPFHSGDHVFRKGGARPGDAVLVKASRAVGLEGIADDITKFARAWSPS